MDTTSSQGDSRTAEYCRCGLIFLDGGGIALEGEFAGCPLRRGDRLPPEMLKLKAGEWLLWKGDYLVQAAGRGKAEVLVFRTVRAADHILGPYGETPINEKMVRMLLDNPYEGLTTVDTDGRITFLSPSNEKWFGLKPGQAKGVHLAELSPASRLPEVARTGVPLRAQVLDLQGKTKVTLNLPMKQGKKILGAFGRILFQSPEQVEELAERVRLMERQVERYMTLLEEMRGKGWTFSDILTGDPQMASLIREAKRFADSSASVLLLGESGTGKELFAQALHQASSRRNGPFIALNCAAIPKDLIESELFGYEEGAFSGAKRKGKPGKFELATGGTLFLDEVGELPQESQSKLLRILEERTVERLGGTASVPVDFRLVSATQRDLESLVNKGAFRGDLYYRIHDIPLNIPPLRERVRDIPILAAHFLKEICGREKLPPKSMSQEALEAMMRYGWPGNVRELRGMMRRMAWQARGPVIGLEDLPSAVGVDAPKRPGGTLEEEMAKAERAMIEAVLEAAGGNRARAAKSLGIHRTALYKKMARLGVGRQ